MRKKYLAMGVFLVLLLSFSTFTFASDDDDNPGGDVKEEVQQRNEERQEDRNGDEDEHGRGRSVIIQNRGNKLKLTEVEDDGEEEFEIEDDEEEESTESGEFDTDPDDDDSLKIKASGNASLIIRNKIAAQTNFPLRVNLDTNELIVNTPKGAKIVTVLPDSAVNNMLAANVLDQVGGKGGLLWLSENATPTATVSATPTSTEPTATPSGEPSGEPVTLEGSQIQLVLTDDGLLAYEIKGKKFEKLLGLFEVGLNKIVVVSAESGEVVEIDESFLTRLLDLISF